MFLDFFYLYLKAIKTNLNIMSKKTYQPFIVKLSNKYISLLDQNDFFVDNKIDNTDYASEIFCETLTDKFLLGIISSDDSNLMEILTEEEFSKIISKIIVKSELNGLIKKGLMGNVDDENGKEFYFLTKDGKKLADVIDKITNNDNETTI